MRAIDTNVLVRLLVRDDARQTLAAETFVEHGAWISHVVLVETIWVLDSVYGLGPVKIAAAIEMLLGHRQLSVQDANVVGGALDQFRLHPGVGFSDCLVLEIARRAGHAPLGTFDRKLSKLRGAHRV